jgi:uncharacterized phage-associated protein
MCYSASQIANEFIRRGIADDVPVDPLKIQKLVYLAQGWHLAFLGKPLIKEKIEAWRYGPVVPSLYRMCRKYGVSPIDAEINVPEDAQNLDDSNKAIIDEVWKKYGRRTGIELSMMTHEPGCAWDIARRGNTDDWNSAVIPDLYIKEEFLKRKASGAKR